MAQADTTSSARRNGHESTVPVEDPEAAESRSSSLAGRAWRELAGVVQRRIPRADLDERDPDYIREQLPRFWLLSSIWFRGEVRGLGNIPDDGPVLLVGNHSGGNMIPDTMVFTVAFSTYFGVERAFYQLAHNLVLSLPGLSWLRKFGTVAASPGNARKALASGAALLVYPGGDYEVHRPSWEGNRVDFGGRKGFIRLALEQEVPIVPVVAIGGQETALFLTRGERLARLLALDRVLRLKVLPISLSLPWIVNIGDFGHIPLPAKITIETLAVDRPARRVRPRPRRRRGLRPPDAADAGHARCARRRAALSGDRMRVASDIAVAAPVQDVWSIVTDPERVLSYMSGVTRWEVASDLPAGLGARYRMLFRVGAAEVGGLIEVVEFAEPFEFAWTSITGLDQRGRWRLREIPGGRTRIELRLAYGVAGAGLSGWLAERLAAPSVSRHVRQTLAQLGRIVEHEQLRSRAAERRAGARGA